MAYGKHYILTFKNRLQNDVYRAEIWEKDYSDDVVTLIGAEQPLIIANTVDDIKEPIQPIELTLSFNTDTISIDDFYSDDDEKFRIDFYFQSLADGTGTEKLLYSTYLIEDGVSEAYTDKKHVITLKATDNLALLKSVKWNEIDASVIDYNSKLSLIYFIWYSLKATGLYSPDSSIDMNLPLRVYNNLFENTRPDRSDDDESDPLQSSVLHSNMFQNEDGTWQDLYTVLSTVLKNLNAQILQADGCWNVRRIPEYRLFADGAIPGTEYIYPSTVNAVTLAPLVGIERNGTEVQPVNENQVKGIQRPVKYVKNTFNYKQPASYVNQSDLQLPLGATPYDTTTVSGIRYDKYDLATYFPEWLQIDTDASYLQIETDTTLTPETEIDRYIVTPSSSSSISAVRLKPIEVTKGDIFDFSLKVRSATDVGDVHFFTRITLLTPANKYAYVVAAVETLENPHWAASAPDGQPITNYYTTDEAFGVNNFKIASANDSTQWVDYNISFSTNKSGQSILIPLDGILLIEVQGMLGNIDDNPQDAYWKDISLTVYNFINNSVKITGQTHNDAGNSLIKAIQENDIEIDDSPRNTIAGTLFINDATTFALSVGDIFFTRTGVWHHAEISEALRLGNILTQELLQLNYTSRSTIEGDFKNLRYDTDKFVSMLSLFEFPSDTKLAGKKFIASNPTLDYMNCIFNARLIEIFTDEESITDSYLFKYIYQTN